MISKERPTVAITMGDASGIGPELTIKALLSDQVYKSCKPLVVGEGHVMRETLKKVAPHVKLHVIKTVIEMKGQLGTIDLLDLQNLDPKDVILGQACAVSGKAAVEYITKAVTLANEGKVDALVTAPISKESTKLAGLGEMGHTMELMGSLTSTGEYAIMMVLGQLRVVPLSTHESLMDACKLVTKERILSKLKLIQKSFKEWGLDQPHIAVAGLNPHAGIDGLLGREEIEVISPAIQEAKAVGINASGPYAPDTLFNRALSGEFDVVLAMYHDQAYIPIKTQSIGGHSAVSVSMGFPFVRTSAPFGSGFDVADNVIASTQNFEEAIQLAAKMGGKKML
jgi:4-hydroxythreonine-4-phosphate dehydrogenase